MLSQAMYNAERRYQSQKSLSTAFLYATLLWWPLKERLRAINPRDKEFFKKFVEACNAVISAQQSTTSIPKKIADGVISIWKFQITFTFSPGFILTEIYCPFIYYDTIFYSSNLPIDHF